MGGVKKNLLGNSKIFYFSSSVGGAAVVVVSPPRRPAMPSEESMNIVQYILRFFWFCEFEFAVVGVDYDEEEEKEEEEKEKEEKVETIVHVEAKGRDSAGRSLSRLSQMWNVDKI